MNSSNEIAPDHDKHPLKSAMAARSSILNDPPQLLGGPALLHDLIDLQKHNDACAIDFKCIGKRRQYTYREVQSCVALLVSRIEKLLAAKGSPNDQPSKQHIVPILLPQSPGLYISQLAVLFSGGAFCPVNLDAPRERIRFVVEDVSADFIITTTEFKDIVSWENGPRVILVDQCPVVHDGDGSILGRSREVSSDELAYVMYTSGSTGTPKGVAVSHLAVCQSLLAHEKLLPQFGRFLQFAAPTFDVSVFEIFFPLTRGCTLVGCDRTQLLNDLPGMINELDVDAAELTPTVVGSLLQKRSNAPKLKLLLTIGEMLTTPIVEEFGGSDTKGSMLYGMFGPTEASIHCTIHPKMRANAKPGNIGVPFETVSVFVATASSASDEVGSIKLLPTGQVGELVLGGPQLAHGYLNRDEQNKAAFIKFQSKAYYRTGDKARLLEDGTIEVLGRISAGQVKLRGQRIELGEIEEIVYKHAGIRTVAAVVLSGALVCFALTDDQEMTPEQVKATCAKWLPKFMVPGEIVLLQAFPYLPSGKVDKSRLEADYQSSLNVNADEDEVSASPAERIIEEILRNLLGPVSRRTRLAAAGLDSLVAIRVASKLRASGFNITTMAVLQADTPADLAKLCDAARSTYEEKVRSKSIQVLGNATAVLNGSAKDVVHTMACTPLQSAMLSETAVNGKAYMNWVELDLPNVNDSDRVIIALEKLAEHNSILRTGFAESKDADGFVQIVWKRLSNSQIKLVDDFNYDVDPAKDLSLHQPLQVQIRNLGSDTRLLIHLHHALYDAWSLELLLDDFNNLLMGKYPPLRPSFSTVVDAYLHGTLIFDAAASKDYWKDHLSDVDFRQVPNFHNTKSPLPNLAIASLETSILTSEVEGAAKSLSSSPQSLFQAAYALVLSSYLGNSDICFGTVFSGRTLPVSDIEDIVGPCLATLPVRVDVAASTTVRDLVQALNGINRKHLEHCAVPLREIKLAIGVQPRQPLFDTLVVWQQTLHSYEYTRKRVALIQSVDNLEFNLTLEVIPGTGNVELKASYLQSLFPVSQINILLKQVEQLARAIVRNQNLLVDESFSHLTMDVLSIENEHPQTMLKPGTLSSPVEKIAYEDPDRPAIHFATSIDGANIELQLVTYSQLNSRANQMGHHLLSHGVLPGELICICMEKCVDFYTSILATAKVGAGYLPVTPDIPAERLQYIVREAGVKIIFSQSTSRTVLASLHGVKIVYIDEVKFTEVMPSTNLPRRSSPEDVSYCVFTSGSTGTPKGVLVTQGNLLSNLDVLEDLYPTTEDARLLQSCSQAFDVSVFEIFFTWRIGGCLCSAVKDVLFEDIENTIRLLEVTHLSLTPTVAALIDPRNVPGVQFLVTAGEAVTPKVFNAWASRGLYQGYGPSETTNICTVKSKVSLQDSINNIGPPFKNTSAFVLSPGTDFDLIPRGGEGEFCFGGSQVFRGYIDQMQNIGKIIEHPTFGRLYRSGDFGRLMPDGSLAFTGRKDDQVKIRGQRVELGEINNVMLRSNEISDCMTMVMGGITKGSQRLICFWTPELGTSTHVECLRSDRLVLASLYKMLEAALPPYMIPSALIPISHLPSTSQGKIDKRRLAKIYKNLDVNYLDSTAHTLKAPSDHTWTETEQAVSKALAQYTKIPLQELSLDTSFFNLGIDSISAIPFSRILRETLRCQVNISEVLKYPSIARLAETLSDRCSVVETPESVEEFDVGFAEAFLASTAEEFRKAGRIVERIMPCTPLQEAMLSAAQSPSENLYSNVVVLNIVGSLDKLKTCWQEMTRRHEILRTCFVETDNPRYAYAQVVLDTFEPRFEMLSTASEASQIAKALKISEPPYSFGLIQSVGCTKLVITMHHALYDGIALEVLYDEVEKLFHDETLPPSVSFAPFLQQMVSMKMEESDKFWQTTLRDCSPTRIPRISSKVPNQASVHRVNATSSLSWIGERTKRHSTSLLAVCHTIWAALVSERFQETDVCFGNVVSGRTVPIDGIERLVAPCFNTIPTRLQDLQKLTYLEAFRKTQTLNANSLPFQLTPLRRIQSKFSPDGLRLFDTLFILQQPSRVLDSSIWSISKDNGTMDFPLVCEVVPKHCEDELEIILHSHSSFITADDATAIMDSFNTKLQAALENPRRQLLSSTVKDQIISKSMKEEATTSSKTSSRYKSMAPEEWKIREVISSFTDVPVDKITKDISIFRLGLDSISAVQVAARLRKQGHSVVASDILEHPTIAQLSTHLAQVSVLSDEVVRVYDFATFDKNHREGIFSRIDIPLENVEAVRPCTAIQQGMIAQTLHSLGEQYVNSMWLELLPDASIAKLRAAWTMVSKEHEMLRSGFVQTDDPKNPFALVTYTKESFSLPWFDGEERAEISTIDHLARRPWNLTVQKNCNKVTVKFTAHHALYDAQSIQLILSDVRKAYFFQYLGHRANINLLLGPILLQERDEVDAKQLYWQRNENKIVVNRFPDLTPLRVSGFTTAIRGILSQVRTSDLEDLCRQRGVTVQAAGQAAWARLLTAYTGESNNTFGITLSGRSVHENADSIPFPSIVTLPARCDVTGTNAELLSRTMNANASLHKYQFTPLTSIQRWAGFHGGNIFDTLFAYQKLPFTDEVKHPMWKVVREEANVDYAISLEVQPTSSGDLTLRLTFRENLIPVEQADILLKQYDSLLLDILNNPDGACDVAPELDNRLLSITPAKEYILPGSFNLLHAFLERGALEFPDKKALEFALCLELDSFQSQFWTYGQVNEEGNKVAQLLCHRGIVPGQLIAICFDKCAEASFAILGILKAGCAYVALDPNAPSERMSFIAKDSGAKLILTAGKAAHILEAMGLEIVNLDLPKVLEGFSSHSPKLSRDISPQDTCYCLYTSGTTGTPKGCLITHENAVQAMYSFQRLFYPHWTESSKWLQFASFHFDVSVLEQFWSWSVGICVASAPRDLIFEDIPGAIQRLGITHIDLTPSLARLVHPDDVPALCKGVFITGGEQLTQEILDVWGDHACIYNGYGPTEATIGCTMYPRVPQNGKPSNIGPQFDNVGSYVLKPNTSLPVLRGGIGELCVSGKLVGKGYLNRPDLTTERFPILLPFNERVYRTGDLVRILHDGSFIFLGRADDQVKLRGQRLELSEITQVIKNSIEGLEEIVTLVLRHKTQQKEQLVTFFVPSSREDENRTTVISAMREACTARLPGYMLPTHFIPIKAVPLNANNKADAKQLATMYDSLGVDELQKLSHPSQQNTQWTDGEKAILEILARVLDTEVSSLTKHVSIFELGLDSISIISFSHALQTAGLSNAKLSIIKSNPIIGKLVGAIVNGENADSSMANAYLAASQNIAAFSQSQMISICQELGVESTDIESIAPLTPVQEGMIYRFLESQHAMYFHSFDFRLEEGIDSKKILAAWKRVVVQVEILRTKFVATGDGYAQVVMKRLNVSEDQLYDYNTLQKPVALANPHSFAITCTSSDTIVSLRIFHGLYDGNSLNMMLRRIIDEYHDLGEIDYGPSFHSSIKYGPLTNVLGAERFWRNHLLDWTYQALPRHSASNQAIITTRAIKEINGFEALRRNLGVTHQAVIQGAWLSVFQAVLSPVLTIGMVTSGRTMDFDGAEKVIGPLFNTLPFHIKIDSGMTASSLISRCHDLNMQIQDFQHTPLKDIQKWSPARPGQSLFDALFVFLRPEADDEDFANDVWVQVDDEQTADFPLAFEASLSPDSRELRLTIIAQSSAMAETEARELLSQFDETLHTILRKDGGNVISNITADTGELNGNIHSLNDPSATGVTGGGSQSESFSWTINALQIRQEIASLAKIEEGKVSETSSIFELGLDSIDVIKLSSRLSKRGISSHVSSIIKFQTIAGISVNLSSSGKQIQQVPVGKTVQEISRDLTRYLKHSGKLPDDLETVLPATPLQQSMVNEMIKSKYKRYFTVEAFEINQEVDIQRLVQAVEHTILSSPILRTTFIEVNDPQSPVSYAQIVHVNSAAPIDTSEELSLKDYTEQLKANSTTFAATKQTLCQVKCISVGNKHYLIMAISHALYDGRSLRAMHEDIQRAYRGTLSPRPNSSPYLDLVFRSTTDEAKKFWRSALFNLRTTSFPKKVLSEIPDPTVVHRTAKFSSISLSKVESFCRASRISMQTLGQTCWAIVLSHLIGQLDVVFGSVLACRDSEEAEEVMFPLMNTVAVRAVLHGTVREMLGYMQDMSDSTRQYQHFPLGTAQAYALASRQSKPLTDDSTLFDTLFIYQGRSQAEEREPLYKSVYGSSEVEFPICMEMEIADENLLWTTACKSTARNESESEEIITALDVVLQRIITSPQAPIIALDAEGISVCGLPRFQEPDPTQTKVPSLPTTMGDEQWSDVELKIRHSFHEMSGVLLDSIQKDTTIFQIGLDSILVLKLPALLRKFEIKLSVSTILKEQTVRNIAQFLMRAKSDKHEYLDVNHILSKTLSSLHISPVVKSLEEEIGEVETVMPVTPGQQYMIRSWQASGGVLFYPTFEYTMSGPIEKTKLNSAWDGLLKHNSILRTGFVEVGSEILQVVFKDPRPRNEVDWRAPESRLARSGLFDLRFPPVSLAVEKSKLNLTIHHALYDGLSLPLLISQLESLYRGQPPPAQLLRFENFVAQTIATSKRPHSQSPSFAQTVTQLKWESYLKDKSFHLPQPVNGITINCYSRTEVFHPSLKVMSLKSIARDFGVSVDVILLATFSKVYAQRLNQDNAASDVVFGIYFANRAPFGEDLSQLAAPTLNLLPLYVRDPLSRTLPEIAKEIQRDLLKISSVEMSCASLADVCEWCGVRVDCFVNILKDSIPAVSVSSESMNREAFIFGQNLLPRAKVEIAELHPSKFVTGNRNHDAYLASMDIEIRYQESQVDMGVFGPTSMVSVAEAEDLISRFIKIWS